MKGLLYGVRPDKWDAPDESNPLLVGLARTPMKLVDMDEPHPARPGWVMAKTRMTGICGSEAKQVFMDFGEDNTDSPLATCSRSPPSSVTRSWPTWPTWAPAYRASRSASGWCSIPWLSCGPRGIDPLCPSCAGRRLQPVLALHRRSAGRRASTPARARTRPVASPTTSRPTTPCSSPCPTASPTSWPCSPTPSRCHCTR